MSQEGLPYQISIGGDEKTFILMRASFTQRINGGFLIEAEVASPDPSVDIEGLIGKPMVVRIARFLPSGDKEHSARVLHGVVLEGRWTGETTASAAGDDKFNYIYEFQAGPFLELGRRRRDSKVFTNMTPAEMIKQVAGPHGEGLGIVETADAAGSMPTHEHFVQYNETDLRFCRRLAERYGINMLYDMSESDHNLVLFESNSSVGKEVTEDKAGELKERIFSSITRRKTFRTSAVEMADYDQFKPNSDQTEYTEDPPSYGAPLWEEFRYPAGYPDAVGRAKIVERRLDAIKSESELVTAVCHSVLVKVGERYKISGHDSKNVNGTYLVTAYSLSVSNQLGSDGPQGGVTARASLLPDNIQLAPARLVDEPQYPGIVTAKVVDGSENDPESMGRLKVHYPFVREDDSFWCRVAQSWAGGGLGTWVNHRIGHEVVIAFEHGDINRPIVMGSVYNGENQNPYIGELADEVSGWRSQSPDGFNEIMFRDKGGEELFNMVAQKDMVITVGNDETETVGNDVSQTIGNDFTREVGGNSEWSTAGTTRVHSDGAIMIDSPTKITIKCGGSSITLTPNSITGMSQTITDNASLMIGLNAGKAIEMVSGSTILMQAAKSLAAEAGKEMSLATEAFKNAAKDVVYEIAELYQVAIGKKAEVKSGGDFKLDAKKDVAIKSSGKFNVKSSGKAVIQGQKVEMN